MKYKYEFTGQWGETLFKSLRDEDYESRQQEDAEHYEEECKPEGAWRDSFIEYCLWGELDEELIENLLEEVPGILTIAPTMRLALSPFSSTRSE